MNHSSDVDLLLLDQRRRWRQGDAVRVESYLEQQPALQANPEGLLDLIYNEIVVRQEAGDTPQLEEYVQRFPHFADQLGVQFEVHQAIESNSLTPFVSVGREREFLYQRRPVGPALPSGFLLAGYEILEELGRGGMGIVYKARQLSLKRLVALKMILAGAEASPREIARFAAEAEAVARLQHPHIVQIHEVGEQDGLPYFSMELVDGPSLEKRIDGRPLAPIPAARLVEVLARAVQYAHQRGILHRDLKPSNVLLAGGAETPLEACVPKITDFGLAVDLATVSPDSRRGGLLGTPSYVAPEQAAGAEVGPAVDVYALGAILYHLLTGRPPFRAETVWATLEQVRVQEPIPPTRWQPRLPRDLEAICLKCLAKEPGRRYGSAAELAEDLRRFQAGEPVAARPATVWGRLGKWCRRRPAVAGLVAVSAAAVLALTLLGLWHVVEIQAREHRARAEQRQEESDRLQAARDSYQQFIQGRDEALFRGLRATLFSDAEAAGERAATEAAVQDLLAQVQFGVDSESGPRFDPYWSEHERAEVSAGCYQLLLILSEAAAGPQSGQGSREHSAGLARALAILERAARLVPPTPAYHLRRARLLTEMGDPAAAQRERQQAAELRPAGMLDYFWLGEEWFKQGDLHRAVLAFEQAQRLQPDDFGAAFYLALCYLRLGEPARAKDCLAQCRTRQPRCLWTTLLFALVHESLRDYDLAEADYRRVVELDPPPEAGYVLHVDRGRLRFRRGQFRGAVDDLRQAIALKPDHGYAYLTLARVYQKQGNWAESDEQLARALQLQPVAPQRAQCLLERGRNRFLANRYEEAIEACEAALEAQPGAADSQLLRARALLHLKRYSEAATGFDQYLQGGGKAVADGYRGRGLARLQLQDYLGARDDYTRALELEPDAELYAHRGWAYFFADAWKPALRDFEEAIRRDPKATPAYCGRGLARIMLGHYREAVRDAEEALRRGLDTPEMRMNAACIFALAAGKAAKDPAAADARDLADGYRQRAVEILRTTLTMLPESERGPFWRDKVLPDAALDPIRECSAFKQLAAEWTTNRPAVVP